MGETGSQYESFQKQTANILTSAADRDLLAASAGLNGTLSEVRDQHSLDETYIADKLQQFEDYGLLRTDGEDLQPLPGAHLLTAAYSDHDDEYFEALHEYMDEQVFGQAYQQGNALAQHANETLADVRDTTITQLLPDINTEQDIEIAETIITVLGNDGTKTDVNNELEYSANTIQSRYEALEDAGLVSKVDGKHTYTVQTDATEVLHELQERVPGEDISLDERDINILDTALPKLAAGATVRNISEEIDEIGYQSLLRRFREKYEKLQLVEKDGRTTRATDETYRLLGKEPAKTVVESHEEETVDAFQPEENILSSLQNVSQLTGDAKATVFAYVAEQQDTDKNEVYTALTTFDNRGLAPAIRYLENDGIIQVSDDELKLTQEGEELYDAVKAGDSLPDTFTIDPEPVQKQKSASDDGIDDKTWNAILAAREVFGSGGSMQEFQDALDVSYPTAKSRRDVLEEEGLVYTEKQGTYHLTPEMKQLLEEQDGHDLDLDALTYVAADEEVSIPDEREVSTGPDPDESDDTSTSEAVVEPEQEGSKAAIDPAESKTVEEILENVDTDGVDADELFVSLQNGYARRVFEAGITVFSSPDGSKSRVTDEAGVSYNAVDNRYDELEEIGVFLTDKTGSSPDYSVHPYAEKLGDILQTKGREAMMDVLADEASFPPQFDDPEHWNIFTELVASFRQGHDIKRAAESSQSAYNDATSVYHEGERNGIFSREGPNYNPRYTVHTDNLLEQELLEQTERETLPTLAVAGHREATHLKRFVEGHVYANQDFRDNWDADELPENLILPQWQELLATARSSAFWEGTLEDSTIWLGHSPHTMENHLDRLPDEAVTINEADDDTPKKYRTVTVHPRFKQVFESFEDRIMFDPNDVAYTPEEEESEEEPEAVENEHPQMFRDYRNT